MCGKEKNATQIFSLIERIHNVNENSLLLLTSYGYEIVGKIFSHLGLFSYLRNGKTVPNSCGYHEN